MREKKREGINKSGTLFEHCYDKFEQSKKLSSMAAVVATVAAAITVVAVSIATATVTAELS